MFGVEPFASTVLGRLACRCWSLPLRIRICRRSHRGATQCRPRNIRGYESLSSEDGRRCLSQQRSLFRSSPRRLGPASSRCLQRPRRSVLHQLLRRERCHRRRLSMRVLLPPSGNIERYVDTFSEAKIERPRNFTAGDWAAVLLTDLRPAWTRRRYPNSKRFCAVRGLYGLRDNDYR